MKNASVWGGPKSEVNVKSHEEVADDRKGTKADYANNMSKISTVLSPKRLPKRGLNEDVGMHYASCK